MVDVQLDFDFASDYYFFYFYIYSSEMYLGRYQISIGIVFLRKSLTAFATIINIWLVPNGHQLSVALFWTYLILVSPLIHAPTVLLFDILRKNLLDSKTSSTEYLFLKFRKIFWKPFATVLFFNEFSNSVSKTQVKIEHTKVMESILEFFQNYSKKRPIFKNPLDKFDEFCLIIQEFCSIF